MAATDPPLPPSLQALAGRADLAVYPGNELLLFALELGLNIEDIDTVAASALTDGPDDKKCDLVYVDRDSGRVVIAQGYQAVDPSRSEAPANKASDLNTAVGWMLGGNVEVLPDRLRPAGKELDTALKDGVISNVDIWYVHNLPASENVQRELDQVQQMAAALLETKYPEVEIDSITVLEVGKERLEDWYKASQVPILVTEEFRIHIKGGFEEEGDLWSSFCTSVPAEWLRELFGKHRTSLFSANVRDYLGSRRSDRNINNNIKETAKTQPGRFWAYNNGLTALVNDYRVEPDGDEKVLVIKGISVVNGAQTTGALGSVELPGGDELHDARVLARFVKCSEQEVVREIIRNTNSQNRVEAADYRSGDATQERLRAEFEAIPEVEYRGGRRGGKTDYIERTPHLIPSSTAAQSLVAFHGDPNTAYNEKSRIWREDHIYSTVFSDKTTARHMILVFSLLRAVEEAKRRLLAVGESDRTKSQTDQVEFFRKRGSIFLLVAAVAGSTETYLARAVPDNFSLRFKENLSPQQAVELWRPIVDSALPFANQLEPALDQGLRNRDRVADAIRTFGSLVEATKEANAAVFSAFADSVVN